MRATAHPAATAGRPGLSLAEAQAIAEGVLGQAVRWRGAQGDCVCPGQALHTTRTGRADCKVVCEPTVLAGGTLAPGIYCFHGSCAAEVKGRSLELRRALGRRDPAWLERRRSVIPTLPPRKPGPPLFDPVRLARVADRLRGVDARYLAERSPRRVAGCTPARFLHDLYEPDERVLIFDNHRSQGQCLWRREEWLRDPGALDRFRRGRAQGVWFLCNPVTGQYATNDSGHRSRRSWQTVTRWRYLVLESDVAKPAHWLSVLAQMALPIAAIYTSGGKSIHALVRIEAPSKAAWDEQGGFLKEMLAPLGADPKAISAVRLTRLPGCERGEKNAMQTLLYLNGAPTGEPICQQPIFPR